VVVDFDQPTMTCPACLAEFDTGPRECPDCGLFLG
jgi:predicted amidophosphoribosyltransferase